MFYSIRYLLILCLFVSFNLRAEETVMSFDDVENEAWFFLIQQQQNNGNPWFEPAVVLHLDELKRHSDPAVANFFFTGAEQHGRQIQAILSSGKSPEQIKREIEASEGDLIDFALQHGGATKIPYAGVATKITSAWKDYVEEQAALRRNVMKPGFVEGGLTNSGSEFHRWASNHKENIIEYDRYSRKPYRLTYKEFMTRMNELSPKGRAMFRNLMERKAGYVNPGEEDIELIYKNNTAFAASNQGRIVREFATKAKNELAHAMSEYFGKMGFRISKLEKTVERVVETQGEHSTALTRLEAAVNAQKFDINRVEKAITDRLKEISDELQNERNESVRREKLAEKRRLNEYQQQLNLKRVEERHYAYEAGAGLVQSWGAATNDPEIMKITNKVAGTMRIARQIDILTQMTPLTTLGKLGVGMNLMSAGLSLGKLLAGGDLDPSAKLFKAIAELHKDMMERFDRLEKIMGRYHEVMVAHFHAVHENLQLVIEGNRQALVRLEQLTAKTDALLGAVALNSMEAKAGFSSLEEYRLQAIDAVLISRKKTNPTKRELGNAMSLVALEGVDRSDEVAFIGLEDELKDEKAIPNLSTAWDRLKRYSDIQDSLDQMFRLEKRFIGLAQPPDPNRIPSLSFWTEASELYLKLFNENRNVYRYSLDSKKDLHDLADVGDRIRKALVLGRQRYRLDKILRAQDRLYRSALLHAQLEWRGLQKSALVGMTNTDVIRKKLTPPKYVDPNVDHAATVGNRLAIRLAKYTQKKGIAKALPENMKRGNFYVHVIDGDYTKTLTPAMGWELVPPSIKLLVHMGMSQNKNQNVLKEEYAVHLKVHISTWVEDKPVVETKQAAPFGTSTFITGYTARPVLHFNVSTKQIPEGLGYLEEHPLPPVKFPFARFIPAGKRTPLLKRYFNEQPKGSVAATDKRIMREQTENLAANWDAIMMKWQEELNFELFGLPAEQSPSVPLWNPELEPVMGALKNALVALRTELSGELLKVTTSGSVKGFHHLSIEDNQLLNNMLADLDASQSMLERHLKLFAPDFLMVATLSEGKPLSELSAGRSLFQKSVAKIYELENEHKMVPFPATFVDHVSHTGGQDLKVYEALQAVTPLRHQWEDYMEGFESMKAEIGEFNPQCAALDDVLARLREAEAL